MPCDSILCPGGRSRWPVHAAALLALVWVVLSIAAPNAHCAPSGNIGDCRKERDSAISRFLATKSGLKLQEDYELALLLAVQANRAEVTSESIAALTKVLGKHRSPFSRLKAHRWRPGRVPNLAYFSPDKRYMAVQETPNRVAIWELATRQVVHRLSLPEGSQCLMAVGPGADRIAVVGPRWSDITIWDAATNETVLSLPYTPFYNMLCEGYEGAFSPNGRLFATRGRKGIRVWDIDAGSETAFIKADFQGGALTFSPDSRLIAYDDALRRQIVLWDVDNRRELKALGEAKGMSKSLAFDSSARYLLAAVDKVILFDLMTGERRELPLPGRPGNYRVVFRPSKKQFAVLVGSSESQLQLWSLDPLSLDHSQVFRDVHPLRLSLAFTSDGKQLVGVSSSIVFWDVESIDRPIFQPQILQDIHALAFVPDGSGMVLSGPYDKISVKFGRDTKRIIADKLLVSRDGRYLAVTTGRPDKDGIAHSDGLPPGWIFIVERQTGLTVSSYRCPYPQPKASHNGFDLAFTSGGDLVALYGVWTRGARDAMSYKLAKWNRETNEWELKEIIPEQHEWFRAKLSPDGRFVAWTDTHIGNKAHIRSTASFETETRTIETRRSGIEFMGFGPDGATLVCSTLGALVRQIGDEDWVELWKTDTGEEIGSPRPLTAGGIEDIALAPNGKMMALVRSMRREPMLWAVPPWFRIGAAYGVAGDRSSYFGDKVWAELDRVFFSPDGKKLVARGATTGEDGTSRSYMYIWDMDIDNWMAKACKIVNRNLTQEEWQRYMGDAPYCRTCPDLPDGPAPDSDQE